LQRGPIPRKKGEKKPSDKEKSGTENGKRGGSLGRRKSIIGGGKSAGREKPSTFQGVSVGGKKGIGASGGGGGTLRQFVKYLSYIKAITPTKPSTGTLKRGEWAFPPIGSNFPSRRGLKLSPFLKKSGENRTGSLSGGKKPTGTSCSAPTGKEKKGGDGPESPTTGSRQSGKKTLVKKKKKKKKSNLGEAFSFGGGVPKRTVGK